MSKTKTVLVSKEMPLGEIVTGFPQAIEVLQNFGVHCAGCGTNYSASLLETVKEKGFSEEKAEQIVAAINQQIRENPLPAKPAANQILVVSKKAAAKIAELMKKQESKVQGLRFGATPGGCSGFMYSLTFEENPGKEDRITESEGIRFFVQESQVNLLRGTQIDFVDALQGAGFKIINPNAKSTCGCGQSFS